MLFGGIAEGDPLGDTWLWDGSNWSQAKVAGPSPRSIHAMAFDSVRGQVVLFGGQTADQLLNDTWVWDGSNWTQEQPSQSDPPARSGHAMDFDTAHGQVVMFGGFDSSSPLGDTWLWDGMQWTPVFPKDRPPARGFHAFAYDGKNGQTILFGGGASGSLGVNNSLFHDTWVWDGANWTQMSPQDHPPDRNRFGMAFDASHGQAVLFGGRDANSNFRADTWIWNGAPLPSAIVAVVNGASFVGGGIVPGEIATALGTNLTSSIGINLTSSLPLPTIFLTDSLTVDSQAVPLFAVDNVNGQQQINFQVPWEVASGPNATIAVSNNGTPSASISVPVLAAQPGIFNYSAGGNTFGAILHANFQLADAAHPAKAKETVLIYCTGLGAVSSPPADGVAGNGQPTILMPTVTIAGAKAIVSFSGLAPGFVGLYQVNTEVPAGLTAGNQAVIIEIAGASSNSVLLPIE